MQCPEPSSIVGYLAGTLEPSGALEAHLDVCDECRRVVAAVGRSRLPELACDPPPPDDAPALGGHEDEAVRLIGTVLNDTYQLDRLIGTGGMGWVYEASHLRLPRRFAVKILHRSSLAEDEAFDRFRREAEIAGRLGHRNIVQVVDFNSAGDDTPYMVLELLEGEDLADRIGRNGKLAFEEARGIFAQIAAGLGKAHAHGIVHRDLKPQNIYLCDEDGEEVVKILDFGISKLLSGSPSDTRSGAVLGTPRYMSPEQAHGRHGDVDARTDVFALGCILYECLSGRPAFDAPSVPSVLHAVCYEPHAPLASVAPETPPAVERVVARALAKERQDRYPTVESFCEDLDVAARSPQPRTVEKAPSQSWRWAVGLGASAVAAAGLAVIVWPAAQIEQPEAAVALGQRGAADLLAEPTPEAEPVSIPQIPPRLAAPAEARPAETAPRRTRAPSAKRAERAVAATPQQNLAEKEPVRTVDVHLQLDPPEARVDLDGAAVTGNPVRIPRGSGTHRILVSAAGYEDGVYTVSSAADSTLVVRLEPVLPPLEAGLPGPMEEDL